MKTEKADLTSTPQFRVNLRIFPFGKLTLITEGVGEKTEEKILPVYGEPGTTNVNSMDILYSGKKYQAPKTTGGIF